MLKGNNGFLSVFNSNFVSIMHHFRDNKVFLQTGKNVIVISPLGASYIILHDLFWKGDPKFIIMFYRQMLPIFNRLRVVRLFHFGWDFPTAGEIWGFRFRGKWPHKSQNIENTLRGHFLTSNRIFWAIVRANQFTGLGCTCGKTNRNNKDTGHEYFTTTWGPRPVGLYFTTTWGRPP